MSDKDRPLPKPPQKAFGRKTGFEDRDEQGSLLADRMAQAAAEGKLEEFLKKEMPDNEYARNLASMMMGMTGMMPGGPAGMPSSDQPDQGTAPASGAQETQTEVPEDVRQAILGGDVQSVMELLKREHAKRNPDSPLLSQDEPGASSSFQAPTIPTIDKETIESLVQIAGDNSVSVDWIILRAIKVYVQEYRKTGKL